ncbi:MAG: type II toxin-antitoxin system RelE family toxin [Terriglobales bacterium]
MAWTVSFDPRALKELEKLERTVQRRIVSLLQRLQGGGDPRKSGKPLHGERAGLWRYRIGNYRIICSVEDTASIFRVMRVGHRKGVYR